MAIRRPLGCIVRGLHILKFLYTGVLGIMDGWFVPGVYWADIEMVQVKEGSK